MKSSIIRKLSPLEAESVLPRRTLVGMFAASAVAGCQDLGETGMGSEGADEGGGLEPIHGTVTVPPREDAAAVINHWLRQGVTVKLEGAPYFLEAPLEVPSGGRLMGESLELTVLHAAWDDPGPDAADDPNEALIRIVGTTTELATVLSQTAPKGASSLALESPSSLGPEVEWVLIQGGNALDDAYQMSDGADVLLSELVPVASIDGEFALLSADSAQHHAVGASVRVVSPVVGALVEDLFLDGHGRTLAVGISCELAMDIEIRRIAGASLSRSIIDFRPGVRQVLVQDVRSDGAVNAIALADSVIDLQVDGIACIPTRSRAHEHGIPRGMISLRNRCTSVSVRNGTIQNACIGLRVWGGHHIQFSDLLLRDLHCAEAVQRDPEIQGGVVGVGIDIGAGWLPIAEFAFDVAFDGVRLEECRHPDPLSQAGMYLHDVFALAMSGCSVVNKGESPNAAGNHSNGVILSDTNGTIADLQLHGVSYPVRTRNVFAQLAIGNLALTSVPGAGSVGVLPLTFDTSGGLGCEPRIEVVSLSNFHGAMAFFGAAFTQRPDWNLRIGQLRVQEGTFFDVVVARNPSVPVTFGSLVELDPESPPGERHVRIAAGPNHRNGVVITGSPYGYGTGFVLVALLPSSQSAVRCTDGEVRVGDLLVASSTVPGAAEVAPPDADPLTVFGRALAYKAAGAEGLVDVGAV